MPNIEVYGYREKERKQVSSKIAQIMAHSHLSYNIYNGLGIIYIPSNSRGVSAVFHGLENKTRPFLRMCGTNIEEIVIIAQTLEKNGYEVETLHL